MGGAGLRRHRGACVRPGFASLLRPGRFVGRREASGLATRIISKPRGEVLRTPGILPRDPRGSEYLTPGLPGLFHFFAGTAAANSRAKSWIARADALSLSWLAAT